MKPLLLGSSVAAGQLTASPPEDCLAPFLSRLVSLHIGLASLGHRRRDATILIRILHSLTRFIYGVLSCGPSWINTTTPWASVSIATWLNPFSKTIVNSLYMPHNSASTVPLQCSMLYDPLTHSSLFWRSSQFASLQGQFLGSLRERPLGKRYGLTPQH